MRKLIGLLVLLALLVGLDRVAAGVAGRAIAQRAQDSQHLAQRPDVAVHGFPFLTQVLAGRYQNVTAQLQDVPIDGPRLSSVDVTANDVRVPLGDIVGGSIKQVPVGRAHGSVTISYADLNAYLARRVQGVVGSAAAVTTRDNNGHLRLTGSVELPLIGQQSASGDADISLAGNQVTLRPSAVDVAGQSLPSAVRGIVSDALTVHLSLQNLPFGVRLTAVRPTPEGISLDGGADGLVVSSTGTSGG